MVLIRERLIVHPLYIVTEGPIFHPDYRKGAHVVNADEQVRAARPDLCVTIPFWIVPVARRNLEAAEKSRRHVFLQAGPHTQYADVAYRVRVVRMHIEVVAVVGAP